MAGRPQLKWPPPPDISPPGGKKGAAPDAAEQTHHDIALDWIGRQGDPAPVCDDGKLWRYVGASGLWTEVPIPVIRTGIGARYKTKNCRKVSDYKAIADYILDVQDDPGFFFGAPVGCMTPDGFYDLDGHQLRHRPASPDLRQRFGLAVTPTDTDASRFDAFLEATVDGCENLRIAGG